jgi:aminoglycoside 6'-N-acetyltransferase
MAIPDNVTLFTTPRLTLRRFRTGDLATFLSYRNDPELSRYQDWIPNFSQEEGQAFIHQMQHADPLSDGLQIAIELTTQGILLGDLYIGPYQNRKNQASIGYTLTQPYQRSGYASEAVRGLLTYSFTILRLHRVVAEVDPRNTASVVLLERLGMRREAHHLQAYWDGRSWTDEYVYAILAQEWLRITEKQHAQP